jgi:hypothetical protein
MNSLLQPGQHPDADQLSAFAEHALPPHEQQQMLAHLADCPDCRALVYLVQQADPIETPQPQAAAARRPWVSGWLSGWGLAIPSIAVACLILLTLYLRKTPTPRNQTTTTTTASIKQAQPPLPASPSKSVAPASPVRVPSKAALARSRKKLQPIAMNQMMATSIAAPATPVAPVPAAQEAQLAPQMQESRAITPAPTLKAQFARSLSGGGIQGTITDPSGAAVAKATVTATNTDTGVATAHITSGTGTYSIQPLQVGTCNVEVTATNTDTGVATAHITSGTGTYSIQPLQVGTYNVEVTAKGFQRLLQENINVANDSVIGLNLKPSVGGENTTITVTDAPPYINTTDAVLGGTIENDLYASLPLSMNGGPRDPTAFQYLMPGVQENPANNTNQGTTAGVSGIYGTGETNLNANYVEGVPVSNIAVQGSGTATANAVTASAANTSSAATSAAGLANRKPLPTLPSKLPSLSVVENARRALALDTAGALFRSDDAGVTWHPVPVQWQGRALTLRLFQPRSAVQQATTATNAANAGARQQTQTLAPPAPSYELTTDSGVIYTSSDGQTWQRK